MDYRKMFSEWHKAQVAENANPYPTGVQGFRGGVEAERERIIALLQDHVCPACEAHYKKYELQSILYVEYPHQSCEGLLGAIALIKGENE
jgi:hypothetical protein